MSGALVMERKRGHIEPEERPCGDTGKRWPSTGNEGKLQKEPAQPVP